MLAVLGLRHFSRVSVGGTPQKPWTSDTFPAFLSEVGTKQAVRALWVELARLVLSVRPWFRPNTVPLGVNRF